MTNAETLDLIATTMKLDGVTTLTEQEIKDKLYERDLILEFEKKVVYEN